MQPTHNSDTGHPAHNVRTRGLNLVIVLSIQLLYRRATNVVCEPYLDVTPRIAAQQCVLEQGYLALNLE